MKENEARYEEVRRNLIAGLGEERDALVWMASMACLLRQNLKFFWVGFYRVLGRELVIGPYQGTFGCTRIPFERGVCGACATRRETVIVDDVHQFAGHIACDIRSNSEIVVPVLDREGKLRAVLDVDSTELNGFDLVDRQQLEGLVSLMKDLEWDEAISSS